MTSQQQIATALSKLGTFLRASQWQQAERNAVTPTQAQILMHLAGRGPARVTALAQEMAVTQPTVSDAAAALLRKGHVEKRPDADDARATRLHVTSTGAMLAGSMGQWPDALLGALGELDETERTVLLKGLGKMILSLQRAGAIPVQRMCATCLHFRRDAYPGAAAPHHCAFVDAPFGEADFRFDCADHVVAAPT